MFCPQCEKEIAHRKEGVSLCLCCSLYFPTDDEKFFRKDERKYCDWWCETCNQGLGSPEVEHVDDDGRPLCRQCFGRMK